MLEPALDRRCIAVLGDEGVERLDQMPGRIFDPRHVRRMNVKLRAAAPLLATGYQLQLDRALGPERQGYFSPWSLLRRRDDDSDRLLDRRTDFRVEDDLREMWALDLFLALGAQHY